MQRCALYTAGPKGKASIAEPYQCQGLHLITQSTPNGQKVQIMLEELHDVYGTEWTQTLMYTVPFPLFFYFSTLHPQPLISIPAT